MLNEDAHTLANMYTLFRIKLSNVWTTLLS